MKGGWAATKSTVVAPEGGQKLSNQYEGATKANPSKYILISPGGKVGADKNGGDGGSANGIGACGSSRVSV